MFVQHGKKVLVAVSDSPTGNFTFHQEIDMTPFIGTSNTGDQTVFTDEESGKSYLIYSYGRGRNKIYVSEIGVKDSKVTILDCKEVFKGESREGNCLFKYKGKYYMCASNIYGWDSSYAYFLVADNIRGPYKPATSMKIMDGCEKDFAHVTQTGFFVSVKGSKQETIIYCGDRWANFAGNGLGYNHWVPLSFSGTEPFFNSLSSWNLNEKTGQWTVGNENNYVLNGSFEADRNRIPSTVKPVQEQLTGWKTNIIKGNKLSTSRPNTPFLNYPNTEEDRQSVAGEKSLCISDSVDFVRTVTQTINSSPAVVLPDGVYELKFKAKTKGLFNQLKIFASSNNNQIEQPIITTGTDWKEINLANIRIEKGSVQISFYADGLPNSVCLIDDVALTRLK